MAESPRDTEDKTTKTEKKPPETVLLTADELRTIAGGAGLGSAANTIPTPTPDAKVKK
jgi:hypothetical protein